VPLLPVIVLAGLAAAEIQDPSPAPAHHHGPAALGDYPSARDASGTSWQPEAVGMEGWHFNAGAWSLMVHGFATAVFAAESSPRGERDFYSTNMAMAMGSRPLGRLSLGLRAMLSLEPTMGPRGYPLLLQTGETADGRTNLFDRQHPHDAFMELSAALALPLGAARSVFVYFGLPGEPAFGPPVFMHRASGSDFPDAPLGHHWIDATHVSFGVATVGVVAGRFKLDASAFNGREPDEHRWDIERPRFSSFAARLTANPTPSLSVQASAAHLVEPEPLHPGEDTTRLSVSAAFSRRGWSTTAVWGCNRHSREPSPSRFPRYGPRRTTDAWLLESARRLGRAHTVFARAEQVDKAELFPISDPFHVRVFPIGKVEAGYAWDALPRGHLVPGLGLAGALHFVPRFLEPDYARRPASLRVFARLMLR